MKDEKKKSKQERYRNGVKLCSQFSGNKDWVDKKRKCDKKIINNERKIY